MPGHLKGDNILEGRAATLELLGTNDLEIAYIAGLFDGEGCVFVEHRKTRLQDGLSISVKIGMTTPEPLYLCQRIFGGKVLLHLTRKGWHDSYDWRIYGTRADLFYRIIEPYLILKKEQANLAISLHSLCYSKSPLRHKLAEKITSLKLKNQAINPDEQNGNQR